MILDFTIIIVKVTVQVLTNINVYHLDWPRVGWFGKTHYNESHHGTAVKYPDSETEEIYQRVDRTIHNHGARY